MRLRLAILPLMLCLAAGARGQDSDRPLRTESPEIAGVGTVRAGFSVEFMHRARYPLSGLEGDLLRLGVIDARVGVGEYAELQLSWVCRDFLTVASRTPAPIPTTFAGDTTSDFGDMLVGTKLKLMPEKGKRPATAVRFVVQLPNASNESGLGTDETEFFGTVLVSKHLGRATILGDLGWGNLGSAIHPNQQADMLVYGFGASLPINKKLELLGDVHGRQGPARFGNESLAQVQAGARFTAAGLRWDLAGIAGLKHFNAGTGLIVGVTYEFKAFNKKGGPVTIRTKEPAGKR